MYKIEFHNYNSATLNYLKASGIPGAHLNYVSKIIDIPGLIIESINTWLWVSGYTYSYRQELHQAGFRYFKPQKRWFYCTDSNTYLQNMNDRYIIHTIKKAY